MEGGFNNESHFASNFDPDNCCSIEWNADG